MNVLDLVFKNVQIREGETAIPRPNNGYVPVPAEHKPKSQHTKGYVYLLGFPLVEAPLYKIGLSKNPWRRMQQMKREEWTFGVVTLCACVEVNNMAESEEHLHKMFADWHTEGNEYFQMPPRIVGDFIAEINVMALHDHG